MLQRTLYALLLSILLSVGVVCPASAAEVESGSVYCFTEFEDLSGLCLDKLPDNGRVCLGSRLLRPGDILTAQQASQMTFVPDRTQTDTTATVSYYPIYPDHVGKSETLTIAVRGKENKVPVAEDSALETYKNLPGTAKLKVTDPEGEALTFTLVRAPRRGTVALNADGSFTYTPKKNKVGVDSFTYTAADASGGVSREATVTVTILKPTDSAQYTDLQGQRCQFAAEWMRHTGIFSGEQVGPALCFGPDKAVTRGEFVTMLVKALDIPVEEGLTCSGYADDVPAWLQPYLAAAVRAGLTLGLETGSGFAPDQPITEAEAALLLQNALTAVPTWCVSSDLILTRAAAAEILYNAAKGGMQNEE